MSLRQCPSAAVAARNDRGHVLFNMVRATSSGHPDLPDHIVPVH